MPLPRRYGRPDRLPATAAYRRKGMRNTLNDYEIHYICCFFDQNFNITNASYAAGKKNGEPFKDRQEAYQYGKQIIEKSAVRARIRKIQRDRLSNTFLTNERIKHELCKIAFSDITDYIEFIGGRSFKLKNEKYLDRLDTEVIQEIRETKEGIALKLHPKYNALIDLARMHGMFEIDNQQKRPVITIGEDGIENDNDDDSDDDDKDELE